MSALRLIVVRTLIAHSSRINHIFLWRCLEYAANGTTLVDALCISLLTVSNREPQSSWWLQVPIQELPFQNHFRNFPTLFQTRKYWSSQKYRKCYDCIRLSLLSSSSYSIYYYTLKLSSRIITTILYKRTSAHIIYTFTLVTNTSVVFTHLRQRLR